MSEVAKVFSCAPIGFDGQLVEIESDLKRGLPTIQIVGLGNKAIDEAKERVRSAISNSLLEFPTQKITINLAPAEIPKDGTLYDVPIALAILVASGQLRQSEVAGALFAGELALDGSIRAIKGSITIAETAKTHGISTVFLPSSSAPQATLVHGVTIIGVSSLKELFLHLKKEQSIEPTPQPKLSSPTPVSRTYLDDIQGQDQAKRAIVIAAAGHHNILLTGSPGAGKTMLASVLPSLLPPLNAEEQIAVTKLHSLAGETLEDIVKRRPFRSPHHTSSRTALIGGGAKLIPGEISLAHHGVLFLDEIPEYPRSTLEALRQPLEDRTVSISRASGRATYPSDFMLVATMNPCPCGYYGDNKKECTCSSTQILAYQKRLSGPFLDRIDMVIHVPRLPNETLLDAKQSSDSQHKQMQVDISDARKLQSNRYKASNRYNNSLSSSETKQYIALSPAVRQMLKIATDKLDISARSYFKIIKVARTIADLEKAEAIAPEHVAEALQHRQLTS